MANFIPESLNVIPNGESSVLVKYTMARFVYYDSSPMYFHYKTNIPKKSNLMFMIEAIGYSYGASQGIRCSWSGYPYSGTDNILNVGLHTAYPGLSANSVYYSSDNYVVLVGYGHPYCSGWTFNSYFTNPNGYGFDFKILASIQSTSATYY